MLKLRTCASKADGQHSSPPSHPEGRRAAPGEEVWLSIRLGWVASQRCAQPSYHLIKRYAVYGELREKLDLGSPPHLRH